MVLPCSDDTGHLTGFWLGERLFGSELFRMKENSGNRPSLPAELITCALNGIFIKAALELGKIQGRVGNAPGKV